jgi:hypothetical protein
MLHFIATISSISALYKICNPLDDSSGILGTCESKARYTAAAFELFHILLRLPANAVTISKVMSSSEVMMSLEQVRLGCAVFLHATSINHACDPKSTLRFHFRDSFSREMGINGIDSISNDLNSKPIGKYPKLFADMHLEIVSTRSWALKEEITISYGPIAGRDNLQTEEYFSSNTYFIVDVMPVELRT